MPKTLTLAEARKTIGAATKKAQSMWGKNAGAQFNYNHKALPCSVGVVMMGMFFEVRGQGETWDACFEDVERKKKQDEERLQKAKALGSNATVSEVAKALEEGRV